MPPLVPCSLMDQVKLRARKATGLIGKGITEAGLGELLGGGDEPVVLIVEDPAHIGEWRVGLGVAGGLGVGPKRALERVWQLARVTAQQACAPLVRLREMAQVPQEVVIGRAGLEGALALGEVRDQVIRDLAGEPQGADGGLAGRLGHWILRGWWWVTGTTGETSG